MTQKTTAIARGVGMISATAALMAGVTFASWNTSVTLTNNQVGVASANLEVSTDGQNFAKQVAGFKALKLVPGADFASPYSFTLRNSGDTDLNLSVGSTLKKENIPAGLDTKKVWGRLTAAGYPVATFQLFDLVDKGTVQVPAAVKLAKNATLSAVVEWKVEDSAITGEGAMATENFNVIFTGNPVTTP